jgi:hypothetical protein
LAIEILIEVLLISPGFRKASLDQKESLNELKMIGFGFMQAEKVLNPEGFSSLYPHGF